jgi:epoxyqueuosine reductase
MAPPADESVTPLERSALAKRAAAELGFDACGVTIPEASPAASVLDSWLANGFHGEMAYLARQAHVRRDPSRAWKEARSIVVVLHNYYSRPSPSMPEYRVAKYAQAEDYHKLTKDKLGQLGNMIVAGSSGSWRSYVDAGPMPERDLALRAGLGWIGKNTMLIRPGLGSFTFIGCLLTDLVLARDEPFEADRCGTCTRCLEACPTAAFVAPRVMDARRCISYLTIESRSDIPEALRVGVGDNLFGCDICQDVCPWNERFAPETAESGFRPDALAYWPSTDEILAMDEETFEARFGRTAMERAGVRGLQRNARVVRENLR